jgi:hypothetical protein
VLVATSPRNACIQDAAFYREFAKIKDCMHLRGSEKSKYTKIKVILKILLIDYLDFQ